MSYEPEMKANGQGLDSSLRFGRQSFLVDYGGGVAGGGSIVARSMLSRRTLPQVEMSLEDLEREPTKEDFEAALLCKEENLMCSKMNLLCEIHGGNLTEQGLVTAEKYDISIPEDLLEAWNMLQEAETPSFVEVGIERLDLPYSLNEFNEIFLTDKAKKSFKQFLEENGELEVESTPWKLSEDDEFSLTRKISYLHPVDCYMAPPQARALKEQCYRRFGDYGICIDTQTIVQDVPKADCFYVEDRFLVQPNEEGGIKVTLRFEIRFIAWTMFRMIIETTTRKETKEVFDKYKSMLEKFHK